MIDHLDEGKLQALLDEELEAEAAAEAHSHLAVCGACEAELMVLREGSALVAAAVLLLDEPGVQRMIPPPSVRRRVWFGMAAPKAAAVLIAFATATAAAAFPFRGWIAERLDLTASVVNTEELVMASEVVTPLAGPVQSGVSVEPEGGHLRIVLVRPARDLRIRATITESARGGAYAIGESASARFSTGVGVLEVIEATGGELRLEIPSRATTATVELDGRLFLTKEGDQLRLLVSAGETSGAEVLYQLR